ncbi:MAG: flagellar basal body-associated FliL family protein [Rhodospirillales bacterium]|jgi:flagellar FliL protein|nr:flagellar basal body-associated FliL family protein [Rhodospirillales bacterium]
MAEDLEELDAEEIDDAGEGAGSMGKRGSRKMLLIIIGAVVLVLIGSVAGAWFTGLLDPVVAMVTGEPATPEEGGEGAGGVGVVYLDLPEILVNLNTGSRTKSTFLKIRVSLELPNGQDVPQVEAQMTRVMDAFNVFLRELRIEDLKGSAGMYRLREELLARVTVAVAPIQVNDVLFKEMLVN